MAGTGASITRFTKQGEIQCNEENVINTDGNLNSINNALITDGFKKVYINNNAAWSSMQYRRIARLFTKIKK